jgi:hypothetical protein
MINYPVFLTYLSLIIFIPCLVAPQQSQTPLQYDSTKIKIKCKVNTGFSNKNCKQISGRYRPFGSVNFIFLKIKRRLEISRFFAYFVPVLVVLFQSNTIMRRMKPYDGKNNVYDYTGYNIP